MNSTDEDSLLEEDYYAFLNISRQASQDEITSAYRRLSRLYHPDKHVDPIQKNKADLLFGKIKRAYEVLNDPHKRAIYDSVGVKGLNTDGWEVVQRTKTPQEIREEYENLARERNERRLQQRTNPRGNVTVNINATDLFSPYDDEYGYGEFLGRTPFSYIGISGMSISQSIEAPLTLRDTLSMSGNLSTHNGTGSGNISFSTKRLLAKNGWIEAEFSAGNGPNASFKIFRSLTKTIFANIDTQFHMDPAGIRLGFRTMLGMPLDTHTQGYLTWNVGLSSSMSTMVIRDTEFSHSGLIFTLGVTNSFICCHHLWKINKQDLKLRVYGKIGTLSTIVECAAEKKVSEQSSLSASVSVGVPIGVYLKIKIIRAHQTYIFPIHLCEEPRLIPVVYAAVTPFIVWFALKKLVVDPFLKEQKEKDIERKREINKKKMTEKKKEAKAAVDLMETSFARIRTEEENKNGLILLRALYGKNADLVAKIDDGERHDEVIEVTVPLQCLVKDSQLTLHDAYKSELTGFYDPCVGEDKVLYIKYLHRSHLHEVTILDKESLRIPKQSHRVSGGS